ncbi:MAG: hypothetical protein LKI17_05665 [Megasphaera cerevisiae]|nr:hypothetical protein [Megasphaera cerevisiae]
MFILDDLITEGNEISKEKFRKNVGYGDYFVGEDYEKWMDKCILYLEKKYKGSALYEKFIETSRDAGGNDQSYYDKMIGILLALKDWEEE